MIIKHTKKYRLSVRLQFSKFSLKTQFARTFICTSPSLFKVFFTKSDFAHSKNVSEITGQDLHSFFVEKNSYAIRPNSCSSLLLMFFIVVDVDVVAATGDKTRTVALLYFIKLSFESSDFFWGEPKKIIHSRK